MENVYNALEEVIQCITESSDYQTCLSLKEKMSENEEITNLIEKIKKTQKKYIRSEYDKSVKEELDSLEKRLEEIPIYSVYLEKLEKVNEMISYVEERLNTYFTNLYQ